MNELLALGVSHKTAPVAVRERLAFTDRQAVAFATEATEHADIHEAVVICTCNRTEVYLVVGDPVAAETAVLGMLAQRTGIRPTELADIIYSPRNCDAARQLYRVTSGLESMILGEAEIQGQVKRAYEAALAAGATGPTINRLFNAALTTGKRVRSETAIGATRVSVPSVAVDLARTVLGDLAERHVVIIGAGETSELTARALAEQGVQHGVRRQPARRPRPQPRRALRRPRRPRSRICPSSSSRPTSCCPRPPRRTRSSARTSSRS